MLTLSERSDCRIDPASGEKRLYLWRNRPLARHGRMVAPPASRFSTGR